MNRDDQHTVDTMVARLEAQMESTGDHGCRGVLISAERYQQLVDDAAGFAAARARSDDLRRQLDERDEREREAAERISDFRLMGKDTIAAAVQCLRDDGRPASANALEALATAPATAIAAVLPATAEDAAALREWQNDRAKRVKTFEPDPSAFDDAREALCGPGQRALARAVIVEPIPSDDVEKLVALFREAERDGRHMSETEDAVRAIAAAAIAHDRQRRDEKYLRCEACGHEEGEPFAPGDSHAGCDGPLLCVTCGTGIATPRVEPDEAMVERLCEVAVRAWNKTPRRPNSSYQPWPEAVRAILAHPLVAQRMAPPQSEASGPLVDAIGRILRDTIDHEPDFRRGAERVAAEVARRLPTARELADGYLPFVWSQSDCYARAANILSAIRTRLGLDPQAPPGAARALDFIRESQPAATRECAESAKQLRSWLTNQEPFPDDETIEAMWGLVNVLDPDGDDEDDGAQPGAEGGA